MSRNEHHKAYFSGFLGAPSDVFLLLHESETSGSLLHLSSTLKPLGLGVGYPSPEFLNLENPKEMTIGLCAGLPFDVPLKSSLEVGLEAIAELATDLIAGFVAELDA